MDEIFRFTEAVLLQPLSCYLYNLPLFFDGKIDFGYIFTGRNIVVTAFDIQLKGRPDNGIPFSFNPFHQRRVARSEIIIGADMGGKAAKSRSKRPHLLAIAVRYLHPDFNIGAVMIEFLVMVDG